MIKQLRRRFITIAMLSVFLVLVLVMGSVNAANYINVTADSDSTLQKIVDNDGTYPMMSFEIPGSKSPGSTDPGSSDAGSGSGSGNTDSGSTDPGANADTGAPGGNVTPPSGTASGAGSSSGSSSSKSGSSGGGSGSSDGSSSDSHSKKTMDIEAPFNTRYFTVTLDDEGNVLDTNTQNIAAVDKDQAGDMGSALYAVGDAAGYDGIYRFTSFKTDDGDTMYVFLDCNRSLANVRTFMLVSSGISLGSMLLVFLLVMIFSNMILKPVAESYAKQKSFITNASHEIKTPLAIIDANVDVMEMMEGESEWTRSTKHQIRRLSSLTEKLVFLSRMDEENHQVTTEEFDLSEAVRETAESFEGVAESRKKKLDINVTEGIMYTGNEEMICQVVSLLMDNAMKYSSENGDISVSLSRQGNKKVIRLENSVDHIRNGSQDMLFERFYRPDQSRSTSTGGHGIGLSVVRAVVEAHKGKVSAEGRGGNRIIFTVTL